MQHTIQLPSGTLRLWVEQSCFPLEDLLTYGVRKNPKRGFLLVSRVLGKHIPVTVQQAEKSYQILSQKLKDLQLIAPHFIGLAETATALAEGVYQHYVNDQESILGHRDIAYQGVTLQNTTRYITDHPVLFYFEEPHSHAPAHIVYEPCENARLAKELVLIDDELSTGTTLQNLATAWIDKHPHVERVVLVSLTDWCPRRKEIEQILQRPTYFISLLTGELDFVSHPSWRPEKIALSSKSQKNKTTILPAESPRFGKVGTYHFPATSELDVVGKHVLVVGTGEYQHAAYLLAKQIDAVTASCHWSATTRSPVVPILAMQHTLSFSDHMGDGMPNFLYNVDPKNYDRIFVVYEGGCSPSEQFIEQLGDNVRLICSTPL